MLKFYLRERKTISSESVKGPAGIELPVEVMHIDF